jgi:phosphoribosylamine--glycine ligase
VTAGGRVLCVTAYGDSFRSAIDTAYDSVRKIKFMGEGGKDEAQYRTDIGAKALARFEGK